MNLFDGTHEKILRYLIIFLVVYGIAVVIDRVVAFLIQRYIDKATAKLKVDPTNYKFFRHLFRLLIFVAATLAIFILIPELHQFGLTLSAGAGVLTVVLGFAGQQALSNIVGGVFIVIYKPLRVGDLVQIGNFAGTVEDINLRHTTIRNFENRRIVIPNAVISSETILNSNLVEDQTCVFLEMGISYDSDVDLAMEIMRKEVLAHPNFIDHRSPEEIEQGNHPVVVRLVSLGDSSVNLRAYLWANSPGDGFVAKCDLLKSIKANWEAHGIEIPFPYRTLVIKNGTEQLPTEKE